MDRIPLIFKANGYTYNLLKSKKNIGLYEQSKKSESLGLVKVFGYEVHKIRRINRVSRTKSHRKTIVAGNEDFGIYGFAYNTLKQAKESFNELSG